MHDAGYVDRRELHCDCGTLLRIGMRFFPEDGAPVRLVRLECPHCSRPSVFRYDREHCEVAVEGVG